MLEESVVQPLLVTTSALNLATECVRMILKVGHSEPHSQENTASVLCSHADEMCLQRCWGALMALFGNPLHLIEYQLACRSTTSFPPDSLHSGAGTLERQRHEGHHIKGQQSTDSTASRSLVLRPFLEGPCDKR